MAAPLRVSIFGAFDPDYPRQQIIRAGLEQVGVQVKSVILPRHVSALRLVPHLLRRRGEARDCDVLFIPAFNQLVAPMIWLIGHTLRKPVVLDYMVGLTDGIVEERELGSPGKAAIYRQLDRFNVSRMISITDTAAHRAAF